MVSWVLFFNICADAAISCIEAFISSEEAAISSEDEDTSCEIDATSPISSTILFLLPSTGMLGVY